MSNLQAFEGASVSGVASVAAAPCPSGNVCIYTRQNYTGRMFKLYYCRTYTLSGWNGFGGVQNDNTGDAFARAFDKNGNQIHGWPAGYGHPALNFKPVWYIDPC